MKTIATLLLLILSIFTFSQNKKQIVNNYSAIIQVSSDGKISEPILTSTRVFLYYSGNEELKIYIGNNILIFKIEKDFDGITKNGKKYKAYMLVDKDNKMALFQIFDKNLARFIIEDGTSYELISEEY